MKTIFLRTAVASAFLFIPLAASAGVNKCVDAAGTVSYSDQPCEIQGQKQAEVKDATGFALMAAQENRKQLAKTCTMLQERRSQCYSSVNERLGKLFNENCEPLVKLEYRERQREQYRRYRNGQNDDELQTEVERSQPTLPCEKLSEEMYKVLKQNFSAKLTQEDMKAIEYSLMAVPSTGYETTYSNSTSTYRKRRR